MLLDELKALHGEPKDFRQFGITVGIAFGLLGGLLLWRGNDLALYSFIISGILILFGAVVPRALKYPYRVWMSFALILGAVMTRVIMSIVFFLVVTPIGIVLQWTRKGTHWKGFDTEASSYWIPREKRTENTTRYTKQF